MHVDFVANHTKTFEDEKPSLSPPKQQTLEVASYTPPPEGRHEEGILNIKLAEIPIISGSQGNKMPNRCHLSHRGKSVRIVQAIGLGIPFRNKAGFQPSNGCIKINLHCEYLMETNGFLPSRKTNQVPSTIVNQDIHLLYHSIKQTRVSEDFKNLVRERNRVQGCNKRTRT